MDNHPLSKNDLVKKPSIIQFLAEHVQRDAEHVERDSNFEKRLHQIIKQSKTNGQASHAAANAITILVRAGIQFNREDLKGIQIPGADLTGGHFDSAQLQNANLKNVNLSLAWMRQADFSGAEMDNVQFGVEHLLKIPGMDCYAISPDMKSSPKLLAIGVGKEIRIFDTSDWKQRYTLTVKKASTCLAFSKSGLYLASGSRRGTIRIWNLKKGERLCILKGPSEIICSVAFSPYSREIASTSRKSVRIWDRDSESTVRVLDGYTSVAWWASGCAFVSNGAAIRLWKSEERELIDFDFERRNDEIFGTIAISPDDDLVAGIGRDLLLFSKKGRAQRLQGHTAKVGSIAFSKNGKWIISTSYQDQSVRLWDRRTGSQVNSRYVKEGNLCNAVFLNDQEIALIRKDGTVNLWKLSHDTIHQHTDKVASVAYSQNGLYIISASDDNTVREWSQQTGRNTIILKGENCHVFSAAYSRYGQIVIADSHLRLYNYDREKNTVAVVADSVISRATDMACSPCGNWIAFGGDAVTLWDLESCSMKVLELEEEPMMIDVMAFSQEGRWLAVVFSDYNRIFFWDTATSRLDFDDDWGEIRSLAFSSCETMIATGDLHGKVTLWDLEWNCQVLSLQHRSSVTCLAWSSCFEWIAAGSEDGTVRIWRIELTGVLKPWLHESLAVDLQDFAGEVTSIAWHPKRQEEPTTPLEFVTGCSDCSVCLWIVVEDIQGVRIEMIWGSFESRLVLTGAVMNQVQPLHTTTQTKKQQNQTSACQTSASKESEGP